MLFVSYEFIGFITVLFISYYLIPKKLQWILLLLASIFFYTFAGMAGIIYIFCTVFTTYLTGRKLENLKSKQDRYIKENKENLSRDEKKLYKEKCKKVRFRYLVLCLVLNFGVLAVLKYANFTIGNINSILKAAGTEGTLSFVDFILPLGISFYTFQTMGYIIDVYRGKYAPEKNIAKLCLFTSFFPQLIQGPISRFDDLSKTLFKPHFFDGKQVASGLYRILWGYFKKVVIADRLLMAVTALVHNPDQYQGVYVFLGMVFYGATLYADFTGGIDITIGIGQVLGIKVTENFERPFFSKNIAEYWRRWHITLGTWFKEYLFYPISVSRPMLDLSKKARTRLGDAIGKRLPIYVASITVWFITGFWHGASWNFIVWGLLNCLVIMVSQELNPLYEKFHAKFPGLSGSFGYRLFEVVRTFLIMCSLRILDCYRDVSISFQMFFSMFTKWNVTEIFKTDVLLKLGLSAADYLIVFCGVLVLLAVSLIQRGGSVREKLFEKSFAFRFTVITALFIAVLVFGAYGIGYDSSQFIYNQF